jgi:hypothetical protein
MQERSGHGIWIGIVDDPPSDAANVVDERNIRFGHVIVMGSSGESFRGVWVDGGRTVRRWSSCHHSAVPHRHEVAVTRP